MKIFPDQQSNLQRSAKIAQKIRFALIIVLCIPCLAVIKTLINPRDTNAGILTIDVGEQTADLFLTAFSALSNALVYLATYVSFVFCGRAYKKRVYDMIVEKKGGKKVNGIPLDTLCMLHNSVNNKNPCLALLTSSNSWKAYLAIIILVLSFSVNVYSSVIPLSLVRFNDIVEERSAIRNIPVITISDSGFSENSPFGGNGKVSGGFLTVFYFSQLSASGQFFGKSLDNGTVALVNFPWANNDDDSRIVVLNDTALLNFDIVDWSYKIVPANDPQPNIQPHLLDFYDKWNVTAIQDGSSFSFGPDVDFNCWKTVNKPWTNCRVPDSIPFTIVQKLPTLYPDPNTDYSRYSSEVFYLPGATISGYPNANTSAQNALETVYVFQGKLQFYRSSVSGRRNVSTSSWDLFQAYDSTKKGSRGRIKTFTNQEEEIFAKLKIAAARLLQRQFTAQSVGSRSIYTWNQLRELISVDRLDYQQSFYTQNDYKNELIGRLARVLQNWIMVMSNNNNVALSTETLSVNFMTGKIVSRVDFQIPVVIGVLLMALWVLLILIAMIWSFFMGKGTSKEMTALVDRISNSEYGIAAMENHVSCQRDLLNKKLVILTTSESEMEERLILADPNFQETTLRSMA